MLRSAFLSLSLLLAAPALAADSLTPPAGATAESLRAGQILRGADNIRLGRIDRVYEDGSVRIIAGEQFAVIPADTIRIVDGQPTTSLSRREVSRLR